MSANVAQELYGADMLGIRYRHGTDNAAFASLRAQLRASSFSWRTCDDFLSQRDRERGQEARAAKAWQAHAAMQWTARPLAVCLDPCLPCSEFVCRSRTPQGWLQGEYEGDAARCGASVARSFPTAGRPM
jgi:hypothetical protein